MKFMKVNGVGALSLCWKDCEYTDLNRTMSDSSCENSCAFSNSSSMIVNKAVLGTESCTLYLQPCDDEVDHSYNIICIHSDTRLLLVLLLAAVSNSSAE